MTRVNREQRQLLAQQRAKCQSVCYIQSFTQARDRAKHCERAELARYRVKTEAVGLCFRPERFPTVKVDSQNDLVHDNNF